jgi:hypothetical protein
MKNTFLILFVFGLATSAFADEATDDINAKYGPAYAQLTEAQRIATNNLTTSKTEVDRLTQLVQALEKKRDDAMKADDDAIRYTKGWFGGFGGKEIVDQGKRNELVTIESQLETQATKLDVEEGKLIAAQTKYDTLTVSQKITDEKKSNDLSDLQKKYVKLDRQLVSSNLLLNFGQLQNKLDHTKDTLNAIESKFDQAVLGVYLQKKIGEVLNSKAMCTSIASCAKTGKASANANALREIFPHMDPANYPGPMPTFQPISK